MGPHTQSMREERGEIDLVEATHKGILMVNSD